MRPSYFLWGALAVGVFVSLFLLKYKVQDLENELVASRGQVVRDRAAIRVLEAEWTYLNDPERLRRLSAEHLGFGPATARNIADLSSLPYRNNDEKPVAQPGAGVPPRSAEAVEAKAPEPQSFRRVIYARIRSLILPASAEARQ